MGIKLELTIVVFLIIFSIGQQEIILQVYAEQDVDSDGFLDSQDNCPQESNPEQIDTDGDGIGDVCDYDIENDGVLERPFISFDQDGGLYKTVTSEPLGPIFFLNSPSQRAYLSIDTSTSLGVNHGGFSSLDNVIDSNRITFEISDLELVPPLEQDGGDPITLTFTQIYADEDNNGTFDILLDGAVIGTGENPRFTIITNIDESSLEVGSAIGYGMATLSGPQGSSFYEEVISLNPSGQLHFIIEHFDSIADEEGFIIDGTLYLPRVDNTFYVSFKSRDSFVASYDYETGEYLGEIIPPGNNFHVGPKMSISEDGKILYMINSDRAPIGYSDNFFSTFDGPTGTVPGQFLNYFGNAQSVPFTKSDGAQIQLTRSVGREGGDFIISPTNEIYIVNNEDAVYLGGEFLLKMDGSSGVPINSRGGIAELGYPSYVTYGPDGRIYTIYEEKSWVMVHDPVDLNYLGNFASPSFPDGLSTPRDLTFGPDGSLYVLDRGVGGCNYVVQRFASIWSQTPGQFIDYFISSNAGLNRATSLEFGPDSNLYITEQRIPACIPDTGFTTSYVKQFQGPFGDNPGALIKDFEYDEQIEGAFGLVFTSSVQNDIDSDGDGIANEIDPDPLVPSNDFDDGTSAGTVISHGDQIFVISNESGKITIRFLASDGDEPTIIEICGIAITISPEPGTEMSFTCGSVSIQIQSGEAEIGLTLSDGSIANTVLVKGDDLFFDGQEEFTLNSSESGFVKIYANDEEFAISEGETINVAGESTDEGETDETSSENTDIVQFWIIMILIAIGMGLAISFVIIRQSKR